jgi:hypothetical protein
MKICSKGAKPESLPAVSHVVMDELIEGEPFFPIRFWSRTDFGLSRYCRGYHQEWT